MGFMEEFVANRDAEQLMKSNAAYLSTLQTRVENINGLEATIEELSDDELAAKTVEFRSRIANGEDVNGKLLEEAFAVVREAAWRVLEQRHYDVQLLGGLILHDGRLAEMATGEGKTLVSTLPCYVNALINRGPAMVITVNDYLARRDMEKMGQVHRYLGLTVGLIQAGMKEEERRKAYACDVVYVTNAELGFDYLRDHLALSPAQTVLPPLNAEGKFDAVLPVVIADDMSGMKKDEVVSFLNVAVEEIFNAKVEELEKKAKADGRAPGSLARSANYITLVSMDNAWSDHLQNMENLKENVFLRKYQNLDPADEYKRESLALFEGLLDKMRLNTIYSLWQSLSPVGAPQPTNG
eukprot:CCRYP_018887-RC/>CCRYP_018887-RC protein AED:0.40 eAED:0.40 QI:0/0.5/0.33/1/0.5/0.33/3/383/352